MLLFSTFCCANAATHKNVSVAVTSQDFIGRASFLIKGDSHKKAQKNTKKSIAGLRIDQIRLINPHPGSSDYTFHFANLRSVFQICISLCKFCKSAFCFPDLERHQIAPIADRVSGLRRHSRFPRRAASPTD
jgi:hypothetical protein